MDQIPFSGLFKCGCCDLIIPTRDDCKMIDLLSDHKSIFTDILCNACSKKLIDSFNETFTDLKNE